MRGLLLGFGAFVWFSAGCTAIPINLPSVDGGGGGRSDVKLTGVTDQGSSDSPQQSGLDAGVMADGAEYRDGDAAPDGWLPDACFSPGDASDDAVCPLPPDGGLLDATGDGQPDAPVTNPDASSNDT